MHRLIGDRKEVDNVPLGVKGLGKWVVLCLAISLIVMGAQAPKLRAYQGFGSPTAEMLPEHSAPRKEIHRLRVVNAPNGPIELSFDQGRSWTLIGRVTKAATASEPNGYRASGWAKLGTVAATASYAIHLKVDHVADNPDFPAGRGVLVSIIPRDFATPPKKFAGYVPSANGIYTNISAGTWLFGPWSPFVGDSVYLQPGGKGSLKPLPKGYQPTVGDALVIPVMQPVGMPKWVSFENKYGGMVRLAAADGKEKIIATVLRPVAGIGRFAGTPSSGPGGINTNHTGTITISTAPFANSYGEANQGGFQIIPAYHANDAETSYIRWKTQWIVVGPINALDPSPEGIGPLFLGYLRPVNLPQDPAAGYRVEIRRKGGEWESFPPMKGLDYQVLMDVTDVRILFPERLLARPTEMPEAPKVKAHPTQVTENIGPAGTAEPGALVELWVDGRLAVSAYASAGGDFALPAFQLPKGEHRLQLRSIRPSGARSELSPPVIVRAVRVSLLARLVSAVKGVVKK